VLAFAAYIGRKYLQRRRFLNELRIAKITPDELFAKLSAGEDLVIVDLRHAMDFEAEPATIPGALHLPVEHFERRQGEIPREREIILYCT
jgi:rhodanese-related sulfurtransferase